MGVRCTLLRQTNRFTQPAILRGVVLLALSLAPSLGAQAQTSRRPLPAPAVAPAPSSSAVAPAEQPSTPPPFNNASAVGLDEKARSRARALYDHGAQAYNESRYYQAASHFLDAYRVYPTPQLLFNVAKAYDKLGVPPSALMYYRDYLRKLPDAPDAPEVGNRVRELEATLAQRGVQQLSVLTNPPRALVAVDGTAVGITPFTGETWPGEHRLTVTLDGHKTLTTVVTVDALRAEDFSFDLERAKPAGMAGDGASAWSKSSGQVSALTWIALGTGTAALGATLVAEMAAKNSSGLTRTGAFFGGIGIATSVFGGVLMYLDLYEPGATPTQKRRAFAAGVGGRF
jgi:tetratricopeptide (TPR) repeat protein